MQSEKKYMNNEHIYKTKKEKNDNENDKKQNEKEKKRGEKIDDKRRRFYLLLCAMFIYIRFRL